MGNTVLHFKEQLGKEGNRQYLSDDTLYIQVTLVSEYSPDEDADDDDDVDYYYGDGYHSTGVKRHSIRD